MKTRTGFVSNSSSSSFILDLRDEESKQFVEFLEKYFEPESDITIYRGKEVIENFAFIMEDIESGDDVHEDFKKVQEIPLEYLVELDIDNTLAYNMKIPNVVYGD